MSWCPKNPASSAMRCQKMQYTDFFSLTMGYRKTMGNEAVKYKEFVLKKKTAQRSCMPEMKQRAKQEHIFFFLYVQH